MDVRRQFSRLAGLLELADQEFSRIRVDLAEYEKALPTNIKERPAEVLLDKSSLNEFLNSDVLAMGLDTFLASKFQAGLRNDSNPEPLLKLLETLKITTIAHLKSALQTHDEIIRQFASTWLNQPKKEEFISRGLSTFYLAYVLLAKTRDRSFILEILRRFSIGRPDEQTSLVGRLINVLAEVEGH